jgi:large subunit ribosomal protein L10
VVKNSLTSIAARNLGIEEMGQYLKGPTAIAFGWGDPVVIARTLTSSPLLSVKGGRLGKIVLARQDVLDLANTPPRKELEAKLVGNLLAPLYSLQGVLAGILRSLIYVLEARIKTKGKT